MIQCRFKCYKYNKKETVIYDENWKSNCITGISVLGSYKLNSSELIFSFESLSSLLNKPNHENCNYLSFSWDLADG